MRDRVDELQVHLMQPAEVLRFVAQAHVADDEDEAAGPIFPISQGVETDAERQFRAAVEREIKLPVQPVTAL